MIPRLARRSRPGTSAAPGRLLVLAPLRLEARAVARGGSTLTVERTGAGPRRAAAAALRLVSGGLPAGCSAVAVAGVCGALVEGLEPGDVVVADRVLAADGRHVADLPAAGLLAAALGRAGLRTRVGAVISTDHVVRGRAARARLEVLGAVAVDMESAALAEAGWPVPLAVLRVVVDNPSSEVLSLATIRGGRAALSALHLAAPVLEAWAAAAGPKTVLLAQPRSFCAGVERAIETVEAALTRFGAPVYVRRQIVHNRHVVADLERAGAVFVEELEEVPDGATVVFSAHGVAPAVRQEAAGRDLSVIDATCPLVAKVHTEVRRFTRQGYQVVLIGHPGHDEVEATRGEDARIAVLDQARQVAELDVEDAQRVAYVTQTTLAPDDVEEVVTALRDRFPELVGPAATDICYATQNRQDAVRRLAPECDLILVVGSANSSNSNRLAEVARRCGCRAELLDDHDELDLAWLAGASRVGITAGASAPETLVQSLVRALDGLGPVAVEERAAPAERVTFSLPPEVRS